MEDNSDNEHLRKEIFLLLSGSFKMSMFRISVPPAPPLLHATMSTSNSITVQWKQGDDGGAPIRGYVLQYKREYGEWEEVKVSHKMRSYLLSQLWCGTKYRMYMTAFNRIGMGLRSDIIDAMTEGSKPDPSPAQGDKFITVNVSWITLNLHTWHNGGCPLSYFELEYRRSGEDLWTLVSNNIEVIFRFISVMEVSFIKFAILFLKQVQKTYTLNELQPGTSYEIRIRAHNNAGSAVAEYRFTTLQPSGSSTLSPIDLDQFIPPQTPLYSDLKLILPLVFSSLAIIAAVGVVFYCFKKREALEICLC